MSFESNLMKPDRRYHVPLESLHSTDSIINFSCITPDCGKHYRVITIDRIFSAQFSYMTDLELCVRAVWQVQVQICPRCEVRADDDDRSVKLFHLFLANVFCLKTLVTWVIIAGTSTTFD